jgi:hypothetical protein
MELKTFHNRIYGKYESQIYVFEPTWDSFRPIERVGWDGKQFAIVDAKYKQDLFSTVYGFENQEQKTLCRNLLEETELDDSVEITDPIAFWRWFGETEAKLFKDRPCVFAGPCVEKDWRQYLQYLNVRPRTLRQFPTGRLTKRLLPRNDSLNK